MAYNESAKKATLKYMAKTYDRLELQIKKGMKEIYREQAEKKGMSLNAYIINLLEKERGEDT